MERKVLYLQILGALFTIMVGSFMHFVYALSNYFMPLALVAAVNESTWEHLKLGFWPALFFGVLEFFLYGKRNKNFFFAKVVNFYLIPTLIVFLFYGYRLFINDNLFFDISIFIIAIVTSYFFAYKILTSTNDYSIHKLLIAILLVLEISAFCLLTFYPPHLFLFKDPVTQNFGIIK